MCLFVLSFPFQRIQAFWAAFGNKTSKHVQNTVVSFPFTFEQCKDNTVNWQTALCYILAVLLLGNLLSPLCKGVFCFVFGVCFQEAHGLTSFLNFIPALPTASLNKHCLVDASPGLVSLASQKGFYL